MTKEWIKTGWTGAVYRRLFNLAVFILSRLFKVWPGAWRTALNTALSLQDVIHILHIKFTDHQFFDFDGQPLKYHFHSYNNFRFTERAIEVPIIQHYLETERCETVLEVGNVSNYYYDVFAPVMALGNKVVVDKYEQAYGVINQDIRDYTSPHKFDLIFSISTFEHMDSDRGRNSEYVPGQSTHLSQAADNIEYVLDHLLAERGVFVLTAPIGYTPEWDETFYSGVLETFDYQTYRSFAFRKRGEFIWEPVDRSEGLMAKKHPRPFPEMNFIVVLEFRK